MTPTTRINSSDIHSNARYFREAAGLCTPLPVPDGVLTGPLIPGIVCLAFSVELELKAILFFLNLGGSARAKHGLDELFRCLPDDLQTEIFELCNDVRPNFDEALREDSMTFVNWRYSHEHGLLKVNTRLLLDLSNACASVYRKLDRMGD